MVIHGYVWFELHALELVHWGKLRLVELLLSKLILMTKLVAPKLGLLPKLVLPELSLLPKLSLLPRDKITREQRLLIAGIKRELIALLRINFELSLLRLGT